MLTPSPPDRLVGPNQHPLPRQGRRQTLAALALAGNPDAIVSNNLRDLNRTELSFPETDKAYKGVAAL